MFDNGTLCHVDASYERGDYRRRVLKLPTLNFLATTNCSRRGDDLGEVLRVHGQDALDHSPD